MKGRFLNWTIFVLLCFIWGSSFILMKLAREGLTGPQIASLRIAAAGAVFIPFAIFHVRDIPFKKLGLVVLAGLFGNLLPAFCFAVAIEKLDSSLAGILNSLTPICVALIAILVFRNRIQLQKMLGILIGFGGLCLLTFTRDDVSFDNLGYSGLVLLGTLCYGINVNLVAHYLKGIHPVKLASVSLAIMFLPAALILWLQGYFDLDFSDSVVLWSSFHSILLGMAASSIATVIFYMLVQRAGGLFASLVTYGIPFVALFWGLLAGEHISAIGIVALLIILAGVWLANRAG